MQSFKRCYSHDSREMYNHILCRKKEETLTFIALKLLLSQQRSGIISARCSFQLNMTEQHPQIGHFLTSLIAAIFSTMPIKDKIVKKEEKKMLIKCFAWNFLK